MADLNLNNLRDRLTGNIRDRVADTIGDATSRIENALGTGLPQNSAVSQRLSKDKYKFPLDNQEDYDAYIRFQVRVIEPPTLSAESVRASIRSISAPEGSNAAGQLEYEKEAFGDQGRGGTQATATVGDIVESTKYSYGSICDLYLPPGLNISDGLDYENLDLGRIGGATEAALNAGSAPLQSAMQGIGSGLSSLAEAFSGNMNSDVGRLAAISVAGAASDKVAGGMRSALRTTSNPNTRTLFKSVQVRTFSFNFSMIPTSDREAAEIERIIKFFRTEMYPETIAEEQTQIPLGYRFPNQFLITVRDRRNNKRLATKFLPTYLTGFQATYNPQNMTLTRDGHFTQTDIAMTFSEIKTLDKQKIMEGY